MRNASERFGLFRLRSPFRCLDCKHRFFAPLIVWRDLFYARCPACHRMDLNGWTGKTYTPPFWASLKVTLGAHRWRCEYCRFNFAGFRDRKEVFTFKRWKRYGRQAEDYSQPRAAGQTGSGGGSAPNRETEGAGAQGGSPAAG
jgi:hypothetical protein